MKKLHKPSAKGYGDYQKKRAWNSVWLILKALSDGQWHRNMELREKTKLSPRILDKHLAQMVELQIIERQTDFESGKYPYPVLYKARPELITSTKRAMVIEEYANKMDLMLDEAKDPLILLDTVHAFSNDCFVDLLRRIQQNEVTTDEEINFFCESWLWAMYKESTLKLIEASRKIITNLNITQSLTNQAKRQIEINEKLLEIYGRTEQRNIHNVRRNSET